MQTGMSSLCVGIFITNPPAQKHPSPSMARLVIPPGARYAPERAKEGISQMNVKNGQAAPVA
jgi:hypothetical protein